MFDSEMMKSPDRQTDTRTQPFIVKDVVFLVLYFSVWNVWNIKKSGKNIHGVFRHLGRRTSKKEFKILSNAQCNEPLNCHP